jgi:hypothetical protein
MGKCHPIHGMPTLHFFKTYRFSPKCGEIIPNFKGAVMPRRFFQTQKDGERPATRAAQPPQDWQHHGGEFLKKAASGGRGGGN